MIDFAVTIISIWIDVMFGIERSQLKIIQKYLMYLKYKHDII